MLARAEVMAVLGAPGALPEGIDVIAYARNIDPPSLSTVMVRVDEVRPSKAAGGLWDVDVALILIAAKTDTGPADDELDALLQDVLYALSKQTVANAITWSSAKRAVYGDPNPTNPAYEVAVNTTIQKEQ